MIINAWPSPFGNCNDVEDCMHTKGIKYTLQRRDFHKKKNHLLQSNPVYSNKPDLIHKNKLIISLFILKFIDTI